MTAQSVEVNLLLEGAGGQLRKPETDWQSLDRPSDRSFLDIRPLGVPVEDIHFFNVEQGLIRQENLKEVQTAVLELAKAVSTLDPRVAGVVAHSPQTLLFLIWSFLANTVRDVSGPAFRLPAEWLHRRLNVNIPPGVPKRLELRVSVTWSEGEWRVHIADLQAMPDGERFVVPFDPPALNDLDWAFEGRGNGDTQQKVQELGARRFDRLFTGRLEALFHKCWDRARRGPRQGVGLRLRVALPDILSYLPIEAMYDSRTLCDHLGCLGATIVRTNQATVPPKKYAPVRGPLRILVVTAVPVGTGQLHLDGELRGWSQALGKSGGISVDLVTGKGTMSELNKRKRDGKKYDVFHYIGHGELEAATGEGRLLFADPKGKAQPVSGKDFRQLLYNWNGFRLAVFNACLLGRGGAKLFASVTRAALTGSVGAAIGMQFPVSDAAALRFSQELYTSLVRRRLPVDEAILHAREELQGKGEWVTPILYLPAANADIFGWSKS